jgi:CBS domain-containing protein
MAKEIHSVVIQATVREAARIMADDNHLEGYVIVLKDGKPLGIVTERDIVNKVVAEDRDPSTLLVAS